MFDTSGSVRRLTVCGVPLPLTLQSTALHMAAKEGHVAAVKLLLGRGAEIVLNMDHTSFLHEARSEEHTSELQSR